ncbi:MAG TPA: hypothetical protein VFN26_12795 [Candidatus Acidoferrum sp.]|nr:hypothetical protein [Candidatus Acidoferrum sp.]
MWNLLKKNTEECGKFQDLLEQSSVTRPHAARLEEVLEDLPVSLRQHSTVCSMCREAGEDYFATRKIFKGFESRAKSGGPWFATRVMEAIAARQRELANSLSPWTAVPRFASRLAWVAAIILVAGSAWLYERPATAPSKQPSAAASQEYLFEPPAPPINQDDVLTSMAEKNP